MPSEMFEGLKKLVSLGKKCGHMGVYYGCYWNSKYDFDPLFFKIENYEYKAAQENYIVETWSGRKKFCYLLATGSNIKKSSVILGDSFLRNYYVYHDVTNRRMGLYGDFMLYYKPSLFTPAFWIIFGTIIWGILMTIFWLYYCLICKGEGEGGESERLVCDLEDKSDADSYKPTPISRFKPAAAAVAPKSNYLWYMKSNLL